MAIDVAIQCSERAVLRTILPLDDQLRQYGFIRGFGDDAPMREPVYVDLNSSSHVEEISFDEALAFLDLNKCALVDFQYLYPRNEKPDSIHYDRPLIVRFNPEASPKRMRILTDIDQNYTGDEHLYEILESICRTIITSDMFESIEAENIVGDRVDFCFRYPK